MSSFEIKLDVKVFDNEDYVPFKQVMKMLKDLDKLVPNLDLNQVVKSLEDQKNQAKKM